MFVGWLGGLVFATSSGAQCWGLLHMPMTPASSRTEQPPEGADTLLPRGCYSKRDDCLPSCIPMHSAIELIALGLF